VSRNIAKSLKASVIDLLLTTCGIQFHDLNVRRIIQVGRGIVERKMTVCAYPTANDVDRRFS
jgi:hypothetical protein